jgi:hypothetical protein
MECVVVVVEVIAFVAGRREGACAFAFVADLAFPFESEPVTFTFTPRVFISCRGC